jgi:hypothetical protein
VPLFTMLFETQRSTLGLVTLDVLAKEDLELPSEVTQYPVEDGGQDISDHITQGTESLSITGSVSSANMEAFELTGCSAKLLDIVETFRDMHADRQPVTVVTSLGVYEDMGFNGVTLSRSNAADKGGNWLEINAKLIQVIKVALEEGELPPDKVDPADGDKEGATKNKAGKTEAKSNKTAKKAAEEPSKANQESWAYQADENPQMLKNMGHAATGGIFK